MKLTYHDDCWDAASTPWADRALRAGLRWYKVHADPNRARGVASAFPDCDVIYRPADPPGLGSLSSWMEHSEFKDVTMAAAAMVRLGDVGPSPNIWVEGINEPVLTTDLDAIWYGKLEALRSIGLAAKGLRAVVGNFATGNPEPDLWVMWLQAYLAAGGRRDVLHGIHEYGWRELAPASDEANMLGHRRLVRASRGLASGLRWAITECGMDRIRVGEQWVGGSWVDQGMSQAEYWDYLMAYNAELELERDVVCACVYTWGAPSNWKDYDMEGKDDFNRLMLSAIEADKAPVWYAVTTAAGLNLRGGPGTTYPILKAMPKGTLVQLIEKSGMWFHVQWGQYNGWCSSAYLAVSDVPAPRPEPETAAAAMLRLAPSYGLDPAVGLAVMRVEAGGVAFGKDGRMILRFEPHVYRPRLNNAEWFNVHFQIGVGGVAGWVGEGHRFRVGLTYPWRTFHGQQATEWEALTVARTLGDEAALQSISMGAGQVMGFNHRAVGYPSARAMFDALKDSAEAQVRAMLDYCRSRGLIGALRVGDFLAFARGYNGSGQAERYAKLIEQAAKLNGWVRA